MYLQGSYALGYNLAIEYLADYEKTWMLDSFKALNARVLAPAGRGMTEWLFLEVWTCLLDAGGWLVRQMMLVVDLHARGAGWARDPLRLG